MSAKQPAKSHGWAWTCTILVAAPLLYVLTYPLVQWAGWMRHYSNPTASDVPRWFLMYAGPHSQLFKTPLGKIVLDYDGWVWSRLEATWPRVSARHPAGK